MKILLFFLGLLIAVSAAGQKVTITRLEVVGDNVNVYYDLEDSVASRTYTVSLYVSRDDFISPQTKVSGDIGLEVKPGHDKMITWRAKEELGEGYEGKQSLEIRGKLFVPFVRLYKLNKVFKRLHPTEVTWTGGTPQNVLNFVLYKGTEKITSFSNIANVGHCMISMPMSVRPGKGYQFEISDTRNKDEVVLSPLFEVKRKIPLVLKVIPTILIGAGVYLFVSREAHVKKDIPDPFKPR